MVAQVVREVVKDLAGEMRPSVPARLQPTIGAVQPSGPITAANRSRTETVRLTGDADLQSFVYRLLDHFENAKLREDVRAGRLKFRLANGAAAGAEPGAVERIEEGAVTERRVTAAASAGTRLVLGRRAVLTPLAREKARSLGVLVEKERG